MWCLAAGTAMLALGTAPAWAQGGGTTTSLSGVVTDAQGAVIPGADVEPLTTALTETYTKVRTDDPMGDAFSVIDYLTDDTQQFAAERAINGGALPHNGATAKALAGAIARLEAFHARELTALV